MKKLLCLALALVCAFSIIATASAGTVHGGTLPAIFQMGRLFPSMEAPMLISIRSAVQAISTAT